MDYDVDSIQTEDWKTIMSLSTKILITVVAILLICTGGFIVFKQIESANRIRDIERSIVEQKQLLDNISRAQAQYASKEDIATFAKQQNINLDVIKKDLESLHANLQGISGVSVNSKGQNGSNIPSTNVTPRPNSPSIEPENNPYGYLTNAQHLELQEKFSNVDVPFGKVGFSAWKEKPWDLEVHPRKYSVTSVLGQDENGRHYMYNKFAIQTGGKTYDVKIDDNKFLEEYPQDKFHWFNPRLFMMANAGVGISQTPIKAEFTPGVAVGIMSYGKTKVNPTFSILQLGVGYGVVNKTVEFSVSPVQYNIGKNLPLMNNTYIGPNVQLNTKGNVTPGLGLSVGF